MEYLGDRDYTRMNIIGISGLEGAVAFKRETWPGLEEREYRISQGHDAAAALVMGGAPAAAAAEERFDRQKHSAHFPKRAIGYCLSQAGLRIGDLDEIAHAFDYDPYRRAFALDSHSSRLYRNVYSREATLSLIQREYPNFPLDRVHFVPHHLAHAASALYTSGWDDCLVAVFDGMGEVHGATIYAARDGRLEPLCAMPAYDSIGILYSVVTLHLGFDFNSDEYKIMGLAPYGDPSRFREVFRSLVELCTDGTIRIPLLRANTDRASRETYAGTRTQLERLLVAARGPDNEILPIHCDIAAALQECLDCALQHVCGHFANATGLRRLAMAGGVALNCTANGQLLRSGLFDGIYVQPAAGDDGAALGAALYRASQAGEVRNVRMPVPFLGPDCPREAIRHALAGYEEQIDIHECSSFEETCTMAARQIAAGKVIAWCRGRLEFGPRALGHRSILADPGGADMRDRINSMVKMREAFRPFAPAVTIEQVHEWFDVEPLSAFPYMITTVDVRKHLRNELPAVTHVNGSARVQTVARQDNAHFHALLRAVGRTTGREMVLNTSFNIKGQPMVNTAAEAITTYLGTGIDSLFLGDFVLVRRRPATERDRQRLGELVGAQKA